MVWKRIEFDWNRARAFLVVAEEGSFSAAARALGSTQPTIGRQIAALSEELGVVLFERSGRRLELTPTGLALVEHVRTMSEAAAHVSRVAAGQATSLDGRICIAASEILAAYVLPPLVAQIRATHPGIEIEIVASNEVNDLGRREADIAVRSFRPTEPDLISRKIGDGYAYLYASHGYLASIGNPSTPAELSSAVFVGFDRGEALISGLNALGLTLTQENFPWITADQHVQWALVKQGSAVGIMMSEIGDAEPLVCRALDSLPPIPIPMWLTSHREVRTSRRVRVVFDMLAEGLSGRDTGPGTPPVPDS